MLLLSTINLHSTQAKIKGPCYHSPKIQHKILSLEGALRASVIFNPGAGEGNVGSPRLRNGSWERRRRILDGVYRSRAYLGAG